MEMMREMEERNGFHYKDEALLSRINSMRSAS